MESRAYTPESATALMIGAQIQNTSATTDRPDYCTVLDNSDERGSTGSYVPKKISNQVYPHYGVGRAYSASKPGESEGQSDVGSEEEDMSKLR